MRREDMFMDILSDLDERFVEMALPQSGGYSDAASDARRLRPVETPKVSGKDVKRYRIRNAVLGGTAAAVAITGGAVLWRNWERAAFPRSTGDPAEISDGIESGHGILYTPVDLTYKLKNSSVHVSGYEFDRLWCKLYFDVTYDWALPRLGDPFDMAIEGNEDVAWRSDKISASGTTVTYTAEVFNLQSAGFSSNIVFNEWDGSGSFTVPVEYSGRIPTADLEINKQVHTSTGSTVTLETVSVCPYMFGFVYRVDNTDDIYDIGKYRVILKNGEEIPVFCNRGNVNDSGRAFLQVLVGHPTDMSDPDPQRINDRVISSDDIAKIYVGDELVYGIDSPEQVHDPVEYIYDRENVFLYEDTLYEIDARAAFDYLLRTEDGYTSIFRDRYPEHAEEYGFIDPVRDCLKNEYCIGELNIVEGMPHSGMETNFPKEAALYSYAYYDHPAESTTKYIVADVSDAELDNIREYFSDSLVLPFEEIDTDSLRGVYYVTAQTAIMPQKYYDLIPREDALETWKAAFDAEGMDDYFRTGMNYMSYPLPIFAPGDLTNEGVTLGNAAFYLGNGGEVCAVIVDNKVDESWDLEPINYAFRHGEKIMLVSDIVLGNTVMFTESGGKYTVRGSMIPNGAEFSQELAFPIHRYDVTEPPQDYELTEADLDEIYEKAYNAWVQGIEYFSLGYPIKVDLPSDASRGIWYIPLFRNDTVVGVITAFYTDEWDAGTYRRVGTGEKDDSDGGQLTSLYRTQTPFNMTSFGSVQYICTEHGKSVPFQESVYDKPRNVYLYDEAKAAPLRKWNKEQQDESDNASLVTKINTDLISELGMTYAQLCAKYNDHPAAALNTCGFKNGYGKYGWKSYEGKDFDDPEEAGGCNMIDGVSVYELLNTNDSFTFDEFVGRYGFELISAETEVGMYNMYSAEFTHPSYNGITFVFFTNEYRFIDADTSICIVMDKDCSEASPIIY